MDVFLSLVEFLLALLYLEDVPIFSQKSGSDISLTLLVLSLLKEYSVTFKLKTCACFTDKIDYHEHIVRPGRPEVGSHSTVALYDL